MQFQYVLQYRDATEALRQRFPGDPSTRGPSRSRVIGGLLGWAFFIVATVLLYLLLSRAGAAGTTTPLRAALSEPDRLDSPVFVAGVLLVAMGAALLVVPTSYLVARKRSARPLYETPATLEFGEDGVTLRTPVKELVVEWDGIVAVAETRSLLVLKTAGDLRLVLPLRAIGSPELVQAARDELRRRVPPLAAVATITGVAA
jgi:hypothetical protein